jgi:uncharacterized membrane protein YsdA (DUF1294 family)
MFILLFSFAFVTWIACSAFLGKLPSLYFYTYCALSFITFIAYAIDKSAARRKLTRTPEKTLHLLALLGGWPGAVIAQKLLRHKSRKQSFQVVFWLSIIFNFFALALLLSFA